MPVADSLRVQPVVNCRISVTGMEPGTLSVVWLLVVHCNLCVYTHFIFIEPSFDNELWWIREMHCHFLRFITQSNIVFSALTCSVEPSKSSAADAICAPYC